MDKKRAAIVASAGVGLLVSAFVLHKMQMKRRASADSPEEPEKKDVHAVVMTDHHHHNGKRRFRKRVADGV